MPFRPLCLAAIFGFFAVTLTAKITSPKEHFGFAIGDDYHLATYTQTEAYFKKLAAESERVRLVDMGRTEEGRTLIGAYHPSRQNTNTGLLTPKMYNAVFDDVRKQLR